MRRYAEGTTVPVDKTQAEIRALLAYHGSTRFVMESGPEGDAIKFEVHGRAYAFAVARPTAKTVEPFYAFTSRVPVPERVEREWRRLWRARLLWLKGTLEFAGSEGKVEVQRALASYLLMKDGRTLAQVIEGGTLPLLEAGR